MDVAVSVAAVPPCAPPAFLPAPPAVLVLVMVVAAAHTSA
jgi:hypothetical protein